jgi:trans-aconitate methyltransferase
MTPPEHSRGSTPVDFWEERYSGSSRVWSGAPNRTLVDIVADLTPGRALDLGCGEGADVIWLAQRGWQASGVDIAETAIARARDAASDLALPNAGFEAADLSTWRPDARYDLVTASFLQSPVALSRTAILRAVADRVAPGGHLLVIAHAEAPPWSRLRHAHADGHHADFPTPDEEVAALALDPSEWTARVAEIRSRDAVGPDGDEVVLHDSVVLLRREES